MNWNEYKTLSEKTLSNEFHCEKKEELMLHAVIGILTEIEELLDNHLTEKNADEINRGEEIFDIFWYIAIIGREYEDISFSKEVITSISDPFEMVLQITKKSLKLLDFIKKKLYYNKQINENIFVQNTNEIISLLISYANFYSISIENGFDINIAKLKARYSDKFSSEKAINRNLDTERNILEGKQ